MREPVMVMEFSNNAVRGTNTIDNKFNIKVDVHQGYVLNPLPLST